MDDRPDQPEPAAGRTRSVYAALLHEAEGVAAQALDRLRRLHDRYPDEVPGGLVEQMERSHADPAGERREYVRLPEGAAADPHPPESYGARWVLDRSPRGMLVRLPGRVEVGVMLGVAVPDGGRLGWRLAEVRHCRRGANGWVAGLQFAPEVA